MQYKFIRGRILGFWNIRIKYTDNRWKILGKLLAIGDAIETSDN